VVKNVMLGRRLDLTASCLRFAADHIRRANVSAAAARRRDGNRALL